MLFSQFFAFPAARNVAGLTLGGFLAVLSATLFASSDAEAQNVPDKKKYIIGATAVLTEESSGLPFAARIDTGAASCSLHVEKMEIKDKAKKPLDNIGKAVRFQIKNDQGKTAWVDSTIASVVRVHSSTLDGGGFDRRYKVRLTLKWKDFSKEVLVTLNDRTHMNFPLLVGRNYLRHDFLVDVDVDNHDEPK